MGSTSGVDAPGELRPCNIISSHLDTFRHTFRDENKNENEKRKWIHQEPEWSKSQVISIAAPPLKLSRANRFANFRRYSNIWGFPVQFAILGKKAAESWQEGQNAQGSAQCGYIVGPSYRHLGFSGRTAS